MANDLEVYNLQKAIEDLKSRVNESNAKAAENKPNAGQSSRFSAFSDYTNERIWQFTFKIQDDGTIAQKDVDAAIEQLSAKDADGNGIITQSETISLEGNDIIASNTERKFDNFNPRFAESQFLILKKQMKDKGIPEDKIAEIGNMLRAFAKDNVITKKEDELVGKKLTELGASIAEPSTQGAPLPAQTPTPKATAR